MREPHRPPSDTAPPTLARIIAYALPAIPLAALTLPLYILVPTFYAEAVGLPLAAIGTALLFVRILDAVNDPLIGVIADRLRTPFGRRRTLFAASLPLTALAAFMLFWPPAEAGVLYLFAWGAILSVGYTASVIPFFAWGAEMTGAYGGRTTIAGWREGLTLTGTLIAIALPFALGLDDARSFHGLALLAVVIAASLPVLGLFAVFTVPEPREFTRERVRWREGLGHLARNRPFIRLIAAFFLNGLANGIPATLFLLFVADVLGAEAMRGPLLFLYFACGVAGVPLAAWAARRIGKHRAWALGMICAAIVFAPVPLLSQGDIAAFAVICAVTGLLVGFDLAIPPAIQADVIDVDTAGSGEQRSGLYFAAWSLSTKLSLALAVGLAFPVLDAFGFRAGAGPDQDPVALAGLAITYGWVPIALKLGAIALVWNFPLDAAEQSALRRTIESAGSAQP
ncbi:MULTISPECIES: MFS transporter [unclassified Roseitalea]|uniref:MFS transporter n=1 Tax=unclassified Roseitalea TaxID=2639107 RepID=UPI00273DA985|nr:MULTISPECIES: MFS transporter [unclassified Roseitalea]